MSHIVPDQNAAPPRRVIGPPLSQKRCAWCATRLDIHQAARGPTCGKPACRQKQAVAAAAQRQQEEVADAWRAAVEFRARVAPALGVAEPQSLTLALVPHFQRAVVKLPRPRRAEFRAHLLRVVRQAFEEKLDEASVAALAEELGQAVPPPPAFPEAGAACATCRGHCCRNGGTHAYLNATVLRSFLARHAGLRWREVVRIYWEKLPDQSFDYSCVYHGRGGCGLPREMRSGICNQYLCAGLKELRETLAASGPGPVLVVAARGEAIGRSVLISRAGSRLRVRKIPKPKP